MNPQNPVFQPSPEHVPQPGNGETVPKLIVPEAVVPPAASAPVASTQPVTPPFSRYDVAAAIAAMPAGAGVSAVLPTPALAGDEDVIETEWVEKTEQIIGSTAGDPHAEEEAIEDLQIDYLQKRYGHTVKKPDDN